MSKHPQHIFSWRNKNFTEDDDAPVNTIIVAFEKRDHQVKFFLNM